ncbi:MAG: HEAT repeat domain-containing protein [Chloroflexi bacterium]|nr:HEAT repeat domain-containing protein [Chloroflexota bacterium]
MNANPVSFQSVLDALTATGKDFPRRYLQQFSDIGTLELNTLLDVWPRVAPSRKLSLLEGLQTLADEDTLVNFDDFARALLTDPEPAVRTRAIRLLNECEDANLASTFLDILKRDADIGVRVEAANALGLFVDLGELEEISESIYHKIEDVLLATASGEDDGRVRRTALESLGYSSRIEVATLIESSFHREDPAWQASALVAMGRSADDRWEEDVLRSLVSIDDNVRRAAVEAAGNLELKSARTVLLKQLEEEENDEIVGAVIWSLSQIGGEDVRTYLENLLDQTEDDDQIEYIEDALDNLAFTEDLDRFDLFAFDPDADLTDLDDEEE